VAKISEEARQQYFERIQQYRHDIDGILQHEAGMLKIIAKEAEQGGYKHLVLAEARVNLASYFLIQNALSLALLGIKNESFLNNARKSCYQAVIFLEGTVSKYVDAPFSEYSELQEKIEGYSDVQRYNLVRKLGFTIQSVEDGFGPNSKWRWSFVELEARFATVAKNLINFKTFVAGMDPVVEGYPERMGHLELVVELLTSAADRYRQKYELSTFRIEDFKQAIAFLSALCRIYTILGMAPENEEVRKKLDVWKQKMEADERRQSERSKIADG
jgi:hypothetical protein